MFFSCFSVKNTFDICRNNNNLRASKGVLYRRNRVSWHQPRVDTEFGQIWSYVVLYNIKETDKFTQRPYAFLLLLVMEALSLPIVLHVLAIVFAPMLLAVMNDLRVDGIGAQFLAVIIRATTALARRSATDSLIGSKLGWLKDLLAIATATRYQAASSEVWLTSSEASNHVKQI